MGSCWSLGQPPPSHNKVHHVLLSAYHVDQPLRSPGYQTQLCRKKCVDHLHVFQSLVPSVPSYCTACMCRRRLGCSLCYKAGLTLRPGILQGDVFLTNGHAQAFTMSLSEASPQRTSVFSVDTSSALRICATVGVGDAYCVNGPV